jgi:hypothetical protein
MSRHERSNLDDPTAERTADQSTQTASGLSSDRNGPGAERNRDPERNREQDDTVARTREERPTTPRRYDENREENPVMPSDEPTLRTEI